MSATYRRLVPMLFVAALTGCGTTPADATRPPVLTLLSGGDQHRLLGLPLAAPIRIRVADDHGSPLAAAQVRAHTTSPFAVVEPSLGVTDGNGVVELSWRTGAQVGVQQVVLSLPAYPDAASLTVTATALSAPLLDLAGSAAMLCGIWPAGDLGCWSPIASGIAEPAVIRVGGQAGFTELALHLALDATIHGCAIATTGRPWCFRVASGGEIVGLSELAGAHPALHGVSTGIDGDTPSPPFCAVSGDGAAWCWGSNANGALGDGTHVDRESPVAVQTPVRFQLVTAGARHTCGLALDGVAWCWGANESGQLGRSASQASQVEPRQVDPNFRFRTLQVMGADVSCGLGVGGGLRCWGNKHRMGLGMLADSVPGNAVTRPTPPRGVLQGVAFAETDSAIVAVESDGRGSWWGVLSVATQVLRADEPRPFDRLLPFAEFTVPSSRGLVCGRPSGATTICIRVGVLTGYDFAELSPSLHAFGMPS